MPLETPLAAISDLVVTFPGEKGPVAAVNGVNLSMWENQTVGLVGESGSGKSLTALSVLGLVPEPGRVAAGSITYQGRELLGLNSGEMRRIRGKEIAMIFQEPMTSLNPVFTIGRQIAEGILLHSGLDKKQAWEKAVDALGQVGISDPARRAKAFPHQLSGGMRQRAMIAMALANDPRLLIADEPTTALDVTIQAQILRLLVELQARTGSGVLLITHNLAVVAQTAHRVAVMYAGRLVEDAPVAELFSSPLHPYTKGLLDCLPFRAAPGQPLPTIAGMVPAPDEIPAGCAFSTRCKSAFKPCGRAEPALVEVAPGHRVRCFLHHQKNRERAA